MARLHLRLGMLLVLIMFMSGCIYSSTPEWGTEDGQVHVKIDGEGDSWLLSSDSDNLVLHNGRLLAAEKALTDGDRVEVGSVCLKFRFFDEEDERYHEALR